MSPQILAALTTAAIPLLAGIYFTLVAYRILGKKPGQDFHYDQWHARYGNVLKIMAPGLVLFGLYLGTTNVIRIMREADPPPNWQRYRLVGGGCSAEFPATPQQDAQTAHGIVSPRLSLSREGGAIHYSVSYSDIPNDAPIVSEEEGLNSIRDNLPAVMSQLGFKCVFTRERAISQDRVSGREMEYAAGTSHATILRVFIAGRRIYRIMAVVPKDAKDTEETRRFLTSFRFEQG